MKTHLPPFLNRQILSEQAIVRLSQLLCFIGAVFALVLSFSKLSRLELTEVQIFFGMLLCMVTPLLLIVIGLLVPLAVPTRRA